ncbi:hypothetical protein [Cupriavidus nantongensis]|uniref:hypothetical protein n=1 Tax=Cupriavidus nantongensis TaxID=1796606 RepID=UPI00123731BB|nr:hypothetical protein [Cupriavidus nantongensis]
MNSVDRPAVAALAEPCANCPFRPAGSAIPLADGRLRAIAQQLIADDTRPFLCHKAAYHPKAVPGRIAECRGAQIWLRKMGFPNVPMRLAFSLGLLNPVELDGQADQVIGVEILDEGLPKE